MTLVTLEALALFSLLSTAASSSPASKPTGLKAVKKTRPAPMVEVKRTASPARHSP